MREKLLQQQREEIDKLQHTLAAEQEQFKQKTVREHEKELQILKDALLVEQEKVKHYKSTIPIKTISYVLMHTFFFTGEKRAGVCSNRVTSFHPRDGEKQST